MRGLRSFGIHRPLVPARFGFLLRGAWEEADQRAAMGALLQEDRDLFAALHWLRHGPSPNTCEFVAPEDAAALVTALTPELARRAALGFVLFRSLRLGRSIVFPYDEFWTEALATGIAAHDFASTGVVKRCEVTAFLEALLENVGVALLASNRPAEYDQLAEHGTPPDDVALHEHFGIDVHSVTWALLADLGMPKRVYGRALSKSRALRRIAHRGCEAKCGQTLELAETVGKIIAGDASGRKSLWPDFVALRNNLEMGREELNAMCDSIVNAWWDWGDLLSLPVRTLPGFATLSDWNEHGVDPKRFNPTEGRALVSRSDTRGLDILYVEDNEVVRESVRRLLERAGHTVRTAKDGEEALEAIPQKPPQVVLADWHMPEMDGLELCRHLRRTELGKRLFFILFTGEEDGDEIVRAYQAGINDFVPKRGAADILRARVSAARNFLEHWSLVDGDRRIIRNHCEESRRIAALMKEDSMTDLLTGLPNRRFAMERLREEWMRTKRGGDTISVIMLDIDFFKTVNDKYGHDVGDVVLRETAQVLQSVTRRNESACRIGGEEFLVICSESTLSDAAACAERIRSTIEHNRISWGLFDKSVTVSLGVAERTGELTDIEGLIKRADEAIYVAKESGRNCVVLAPDNRLARFVGDRLAG